MRRSGFTLLELLAVMAILGILFAIGTISYLPYRDRVLLDQASVDVNNAFTRASTYVRKTSRNATISIRKSTYEITVTGGSGEILSKSTMPLTSLNLSCRLISCSTATTVSQVLIAPSGVLTDDLSFTLTRNSRSKVLRLLGPSAMAVF